MAFQPMPLSRRPAPFDHPELLKMSKPERQLRLLQVGCILLVAVCIFVVYVGWHNKTRAITVGQWLVIVATIWSAVSGFTIQRRIVRGARRSQRLSGKSTPFTRWRAGNFMRLSSGVSVGLWAFVLYMIGGPSWLVNVFFAIGLLLLLIWQPGASPASTR
jgi:hypothetical protein